MKCEICGAEVPKARLEVLPNTTVCVKCSDEAYVDVDTPGLLDGSTTKDLNSMTTNEGE